MSPSILNKFVTERYKYFPLNKRLNFWTTGYVNSNAFSHFNTLPWTVRSCFDRYLTLPYLTGKACYRLALSPVLFLSNVINSNRSPTFLLEDCRLVALDMIRRRLHSAEADTCENCEVGLGSQIAVASPRLRNSLEMGKSPKFWVRVRFGFFIDGIGKMFLWWSSVTY